MTCRKTIVPTRTWMWSLTTRPGNQRIHTAAQTVPGLIYSESVEVITAYELVSREKYVIEMEYGLPPSQCTAVRHYLVAGCFYHPTQVIPSAGCIILAPVVQFINPYQQALFVTNGIEYYLNSAWIVGMKNTSKLRSACMSSECMGRYRFYRCKIPWHGSMRRSSFWCLQAC